MDIKATLSNAANGAPVILIKRTVYRSPKPLFLLFLLFFACRVANLIDWSWWFVTMPLWVVPALILAVLLAIIVFGVAVCVGFLLICAVVGTISSVRRGLKNRRFRVSEQKRRGGFSTPCTDPH